MHSTPERELFSIPTKVCEVHLNFSMLPFCLLLFRLSLVENYKGMLEFESGTSKALMSFLDIVLVEFRLLD